MKVLKQPFLGLNLDDSDAALPPGFHRSIYNAIPNKAGLSKAGGIQNVPGTTLRTNAALPAGSNTCIGAFEDRANNRITYFISNSLQNHGIWDFDPNTNTHTKVLQDPNLNFDPAYPIITCDFIDDIRVWTDGNPDNEPRMISRSMAIAGYYDLDVNQLTALQKFNPYAPPTITSSAVTGSNNLTANSWQFAFRIVYLDNTTSFFSPLSKLYQANTLQDVTSAVNNLVVTCTVPAAVIPVIKKIQIAFVKDNDGNYFIFKETAVSATTTAVDFRNNEPLTAVDPADLIKNSLIPSTANNAIISGQRVITTMNTYDDGFEDVGTSVLALATSTTWNPATTTKIHLPNAEYTYGIVYFDWKMRTNGVVAKASIKIPSAYGSGAQGLPSSGAQLHVNWSITGNPPSWASYYAIVRKKNSTISSVVQVPAVVLFYHREDDGVATNDLVDSGKVFHRSKSDVPSISSYTGNIYLKVPTNIPVSLDNSYRVRLVPSIGQTKTEPIIDVQGDKIIVGNFGITNWLDPSADYCYPMIQIEKINEASDQFFYEIGDVYAITSGAHSQTTGISYGDMYGLFFNNYNYEPASSGSINYGYPVLGSPAVDTKARGYAFTYYTLTQSPTTSAISVSKVVQGTTVQTLGTADQLSRIQDKIKAGLESSLSIDEQRIRASVVSTTVLDVAKNYTWDYTKIASDNGRSWIEVINKKTNTEPNTLAISDKYVVASQINGMSSVSSLKNLYVIPPNRSPIAKLVNIGNSGMFFAIHHRSVTSLAQWSGDRFAQNTDGSQVQDIYNASTIIAYDRELMGGYGTIYPESVVEHGGKIYFFDPYKGEVCRYAANGITPIGSVYKMRTFFRARGDEFIDTSGHHVYGGFDPNLNMYVLTFKYDSDPSQDVTVGFIDKEGEERWVSFYDYVPERYAKINSRMFGFVDGVMYEHNVSSTYNNFYGTQYDMSVSTLFNPEWSKEKILRSISTESTTTWSFPSILVRKNGVNNDQETSLKTTDFRRRDDVWYADVMRDANTFGLTADQGRVRGSILIGRAYEIQAQNSDTDLTEIQFMNFGFQEAPGHRVV